MSTDYEIRCACGERFSYDNWRRPQEVQALLSLREHFAAIGKAVKTTEVDRLYGWDAFNSMFPGTFRFFAEHEGHGMRVFDEYGHAWSPDFERRRQELYAELRAPGADIAMLHAQLQDLENSMKEHRHA